MNKRIIDNFKSRKASLIIEMAVFLITYSLVLRYFLVNDYQGRFFPYLPSYLLVFIIILNCFGIYHLVFDYYYPWHQILFIAYFILLISILFMRPRYSDHQFTDDDYLTLWWKHIFNNQIIFINVIGNILLFMPFGAILNIKFKQTIKYLIGIVTILGLEYLQFITKRGIFDLNDIFLNYLGVLLGVLFVSVKGEFDGKKVKR